MGQSTRAILGALIVFGGLAACVFWTIPSRGEFWSWFGRIGCSFVVVISAILLIWAKTRKSKAPDFLAKICSRYFERDGFCFAIVPQTVEGQCQLSIYYQNRYSQACEALVSIVPTKVAFKDVADLPEFKLNITCKAGEFGRIFCSCGLPARFRGQAILWDVEAATKFPLGRGQLLRLRDGLRVGTAGNNSTAWKLLLVFGTLAGHFHYEKPARIQIQFPEQAFMSGKNSNWKQETIWKFGDPIAS